MKPTWDKLADEFNSGSKVLVADVDCTAAGKDLCETYGVQGFPTIKYFNPPDEEGEDYEGGRDLASLKKFAADLKPGCSASTPENCSEEQMAELKKYMDMPEAERAAKVKEIGDAIKEKEAAHEKLVEGLQKAYEESSEGVEKFKKEMSPQLRLLKAAAPAKPAATKDEV